MFVSSINCILSYCMYWFLHFNAHEKILNIIFFAAKLLTLYYITCNRTVKCTTQYMCNLYNTSIMSLQKLTKHIANSKLTII